jgi:hypothetical protein
MVQRTGTGYRRAEFRRHRTESLPGIPAAAPSRRALIFHEAASRVGADGMKVAWRAPKRP